MPEGHLLHRHAGELRRAFAGRVVEASSPQGRFAEGAAEIARTTLLETEAYGKHLFLGFKAAGSSTFTWDGRASGSGSIRPRRSALPSAFGCRAVARPPT